MNTGTNPWRHSVCDACWNRLNPGRVPIRLREEIRDEKPEICCYCKRPHGSGIGIRQNPATMPCLGKHPEAA